MPAAADDRAEIGELVRAFFAAFTSGPEAADRLAALPALFLPEAVIVRTAGDLAVYDVPGFIAPRAELLTGGRLTGFREWPLAGHTEIVGDVAHHFSPYAKEGVLDGVPFSGRGTKSLQFVRTPAGWRFSAVAWDDERDAPA